MRPLCLLNTQTLLLLFSIPGPGRAAERVEDEPDFARPLSNRVPHAKKGPSSVSSVGSAGSTKKSLGLSKAASGTGRFEFLKLAVVCTFEQN